MDDTNAKEAEEITEDELDEILAAAVTIQRAEDRLHAALKKEEEKPLVIATYY
jgi:hypothetical protein